MPKSTNKYPLNDGTTSYNKGGTFVVRSRASTFPVGERITLHRDDLSRNPEFMSSKCGHISFISWEFLLEESKLGPATGPLSDDPLVNPKKAAGAIKAPMHTLPTLPMIQMANVMAGGAYKYGFHNFRESGVDAQTHIGAINRHFLKWQDGVDFDEESGQHELAHVMACCAILVDAHYTDSFIDNRSKTGLVEQALKVSEESFKDFIEEQKASENNS